MRFSIAAKRMNYSKVANLKGKLLKNQPFVIFFFSSDVDECAADLSPCDNNADCINAIESFSCTCKQGFTGDGKTCKGKQSFKQIFYQAFSMHSRKPLKHHCILFRVLCCF